MLLSIYIHKFNAKGRKKIVCSLNLTYLSLIMSTKINELDFTLWVNLEGVIGFNSNLSEHDNWGTYDNPFHSHQFVSPPDEGKGKPQPLNGIPDFPASSKIKLVLSPAEKKNIDKYSFCVEYMRLVLIGPDNFADKTPRELWENILDLKQTNGAIGANGDFFVSHTDDIGIFNIFTSKDLQDSSYNLLYEVCFSFKLKGHIKYGIIDPLIKTSSGHTGG